MTKQKKRPTIPKSPSGHNNCGVIGRLEAYEDRFFDDKVDESELVSALALRSYHLPGHTFCEDWFQYIRNNHPVFGLCCHHALHPIKWNMRVLHLVGSIMFGVTITNVMWLCFFYTETDYSAPAVTIQLGSSSSSSSTTQDADTTSSTEFVITQGMVLLWTVGGALHALYDNTIWYISVCVCCLGSHRFDKFQCCGFYCVTFVVLLLTATASLAVLLRTSVDEGGVQQQAAQQSELGVDENVENIHFQEASAYEFLISYAVEFGLALFLYNPLMGTILFSGFLGCGTVPLLGGRPYEVKMEERRRAAQAISVIGSPGSMVSDLTTTT